MAEKVTLKPCPYCGREDFLKIISKPSHRQVNCEWCGGRGPTQGVKDDRTAEVLWNNRDDGDAYEVLSEMWKQYFVHTYAPPEIKDKVKKVLDHEKP